MHHGDTKRRKKKRKKEVFETVTDHFLKLMSDTKPQIQEGQRASSGVKTKDRLTTHQHVIFK